MPIKRVYSIIILRLFTPYSHFFHPTRLANFYPYSFIRHLFFRSPPYSLTTFPQIKLLTPYSFIWPYFFSFSTSQFSTLLVYLALLIYEICSKYPPYSFNWHLRVIISHQSPYTKSKYINCLLSNIFLITYLKPKPISFCMGRETKVHLSVKIFQSMRILLFYFGFDKKVGTFISQK